MNKKVLATAGIAALAVSATVAKADEVTTNDQASTTASVSSTVHKLSQLKPKLKRLENKPALQIKQYRNKSQ